MSTHFRAIIEPEIAAGSLKNRDKKPFNIEPQPSRPKKMTGLKMTAVFLMVLLLPVLLAPQVSHAASFTVTTTADVVGADGECSLREAIIITNSNGVTPYNTDCGGSGGLDDTITLPVGDYTLSISSEPENFANTGDLDINDSLTIEGAGADTTTITTTFDEDGVFDIDPTNISDILLTINNVTITGTTSSEAAITLGGAETNSSLTLTNSKIVNNENLSGDGGAIAVYSIGDLMLSNVQLIGNTANFSGGGISNPAPGAVLTIEDSLIQENSAGDKGGGLYHEETHPAEIVRSTFSGNEAYDGGGLYTSGDVIITNSTFTGNSATGEGATGGGFYVETGGELDISYSTIVLNNAYYAGGIFYSGDLQVVASIISGNDADTGKELFSGGGTFLPASDYIILGHDGVSTAEAIEGTIIVAHIKVAASDGLEPVALSDIIDLTASDHGGATPTHALPANSIALDYIGVEAAGCGVDVNEDQRGEPRPGGLVDDCDAGAYEVAQDSPQDGNHFYVNAADDTDDGTCSQFHCSLREAINASNNYFTEGPNRITFDINGTAPFTIVLSSELPEITQFVNIEDDFGEIILDGGDTVPTGLSYGYYGGGSDLTGLSLTGFTDQAILINDADSQAIVLTKIYDNPGSGIVIDGFDNYLYGNEIHDNGLTGITVLSGDGNSFDTNSIYGNGGLGIDLGGDGVTQSDFTDADSGANGLQNPPILQKAVLIDNGDTLQIQGYVFSKSGYDMDIQLYASQSCDPTYYGEGQEYIGYQYLNLDSNGGGTFVKDIDLTQFNSSFPIENGVAITAIGQTYIGEGGFSAPDNLDQINETAAIYDGTSEFSRCITINPNNDTWVNAYPLQLNPTGFAGVKTATIPLAPESEQALTDTVYTGSADQTLSSPGQSRWFRFPVSPGSTIVGDLNNLPANYDLFLFRDIQQTYDSLGNPDSLEDLALVNAEFAPDMFTPDMFTPDMFTPDMFTPDMFTPDMFTPDMFTPDMFTPDMFTPDMFTPDMFAPDMFTPDMFTPDMFTPDMFTPDMFTPDMYTPDMFTPDMFTPDQRYYADALAQSAVAISAFDGTADERVEANTWNEGGNFYLQVRGRNGVYDPNNPFHVEVTVFGGVCEGIQSSFTPTTQLPTTTNPINTLILTDSSRMDSNDANYPAMVAALNTLAAQPSVNGHVIDLAADTGVGAANAQADQNYQCVYAKNVVAQTIQKVIDQHVAAYPEIQYIVLIGNDRAIPFYRYPDRGLLANESGYIPPVDDLTVSEAALRLGYVLGQDEYGSDVKVDRKNTYIPVPKRPVGRLVETPLEIKTVIDAFVAGNGQVAAPSNAFVAGYDFLTDAAAAVAEELTLGLGTNGNVNELITAADLAPADPASWTADDLRSAWLQNPQRYDLVFLAGHFSSYSALAADYSTRILASEAALSGLDMTNTIIFSNGCHSAYNLVNEDGVPVASIDPDWAQAFARKGAWLFAGTGYQYGDTDFVEYSERLYVEFSKALRTGSGPVATGDAVVAAKQKYLTETANMRPIHEKVLLESVIYGLPMLTIDLPGQRINPIDDSTVIANGDVMAASHDPGVQLGLYYVDKTFDTPTTEVTKDLQSTVDGQPDVTTTYFTGPNGWVNNPGEPVLPLAQFNVAAPGNYPDIILRGVSFLGGDYSEYSDRIPLTGAATTEIRGIHAPFLAPVHFPIVPWEVNYFDYLINGSGSGRTILSLMPMQYLSNDSSSVDGTMRVYDNMSYRLYYNGNTTAYDTGAGFDNIPALASPPVISLINAASDSTDVTFEATVTGDPSAGIQEVRVTYTALSGPFYGSWQSLELTQDANDSRVWRGTLPLNGTTAGDVRYMVQAANGVGLVSLATNKGAYYIPDIDPGNPDQGPSGAEPVDTVLTLETTALTAIQVESGKYGMDVTYSARLTADGSPVPNQLLQFGLTSQQLSARTNSNGVATARLTIIGEPQADTFRISFNGAAGYRPTSISFPFTIMPIGTNLELLTTTPAFAADGRADLQISLTDETGRPLREKSVILTIESATEFYSESLITDLFGHAVLRTVPLPAGTYTVNAYFGQVVQLPQGAVNLSNPRYLPSQALGLTLISNTPPTAGAGGPYLVNEGSSVQLTASASDINTGQLLSYAWDLDNTGTYTAGSAQIDFSAAGIDGPAGPLTVGLKVCDPLDCVTTSTQVTVNNVAPSINGVSNDGPVDPGQAVTIEVDASDPVDDLSYSFDCDGNLDYEIGPGSSSSAQCTFNSPGSKTVNILVDDGTEQVTGSTAVVVNGQTGYVFDYYCVFADGGSLKLYQDVTVNNCSLGADDQLNIGIHSTISGDIHSLADDVSLAFNAQVAGTAAAAQDVRVWYRASVGEDVLAGDFATIWFKSHVGGDVLAAGGAYVAPDATVDGIVNGQAAPPVFPIITPITLNLSAGTQDVTVDRKASLTLPPGNYHVLRVRRGGTLTLSPGHYSFTRIVLDAQSTIVGDLNAGSGIIEVDVTGRVTSSFQVDVRVEGGDATSFKLQVGGDRLDIGRDSDLTATIIAPNAEVIIFKGVNLTGALYGKNITLYKDVTITGQTGAQR